MHEQTIICRQSFASHMVGSLPVKGIIIIITIMIIIIIVIIIIIIFIIVLYGGSNFFIWMKSYGVTIQMTPLQQRFLWYCTIYSLCSSDF